MKVERSEAFFRLLQAGLQERFGQRTDLEDLGIYQDPCELDEPGVLATKMANAALFLIGKNSSDEELKAGLGVFNRGANQAYCMILALERFGYIENNPTKPGEYYRLTEKARNYIVSTEQ